MQHLRSHRTYTVFVVDSQVRHRELFRDYFKEKPCLVYYCQKPSEALTIMAGISADLLLFNLPPDHREEWHEFM